MWRAHTPKRARHGYDGVLTNSREGFNSNLKLETRSSSSTVRRYLCSVTASRAVIITIVSCDD
jgi:hypothetical protein